MTKKAFIKTFGCQMNVHDSEKMAGMLRAEGYDMADDYRDADLIIYNTCSIRQKAEQKFLSDLGRIKNLKKRKPGLRIAVAGCIAQQMGGELIKRAPHVDHLIGPQNLHAVRDMSDNGAVVALGDNPDIASMEYPALRRQPEARKAWVSIMYGCDNFCTYCIVPHTRGREKSRSSESIIKEVASLAEEGIKEITLLGQNVNSYRSDTDFPGLLDKLNKINGVHRIRFVTSHPRDLSDELINSIAGLGKVCEHIHLPMQSGSSKVLKAMNRRYNREDYMERVNSLRKTIPGIAITTDIITGFPGEGDVDHEATVRALEEVRFDGIFAFKYSPRPGTKAASMEGQLPEEVKLRRLTEILALQDGITLEKNLALKGTVQEVLVEGRSEKDVEMVSGRTRTNKIVNFPGDAAIAGMMVTVKVIKAGKHSLLGEISS